MRLRPITFRMIALLTFALIAAACSADSIEVDAAAVASEAEAVVEETSTEATEVAETTPDEVEVAADVTEEDTAPDVEVAEEEAAPEPITASTVPETTSDDFPDILAAQATPTGDNTWRFDVTVSSTYDTPQRYADAWRVVGPDGTEFGIRVLAHDHASEQPFTRSQSGIVIPADVTTVTIEGRDLANGWGGGFLEVNLAGE